MSPYDVVARIKNLAIPTPQFKENWRLFRLGRMHRPSDNAIRATSALPRPKKSKPRPLQTVIPPAPNTFPRTSWPLILPPTHPVASIRLMNALALSHENERDPANQLSRTGDAMASR